MILRSTGFLELHSKSCSIMSIIWLDIWFDWWITCIDSELLLIGKMYASWWSTIFQALVDLVCYELTSLPLVEDSYVFSSRIFWACKMRLLYWQIWVYLPRWYGPALVRLEICIMLVCRGFPLMFTELLRWKAHGLKAWSLVLWSISKFANYVGVKQALPLDFFCSLIIRCPFFE